MGVPTKIGFFFWGFDVTYPPQIANLKSQIANLKSQISNAKSLQKKQNSTLHYSKM
jgi:hypothetical protein